MHCENCKGRGWVFDFLHWPKDHWAEACPICKGLGSFDVSRIAKLLKMNARSIENVCHLKTTPETGLKVLNAMAEAGLV